MNFVTKWSVEQCGSKYGCATCTKPYCKPREELSATTGCSEHLAGMLQSMHGIVTHPKIADRVADYIGATSEERDQIVAPVHHGTYVPGMSKPPTRYAPCSNWSAKGVVVIDQFGDEVQRYPTVRLAASCYRVNEDVVSWRCKRKMTTHNEFDHLGVTFRYAHEWDIMSPELRLLDILRANNEEECDCPE